jgi:hypothetical protein
MQQMMKKITCASILLFFSISALYAANSKNMALNIQGNGNANLVDGFKHALIIEANAAGYRTTESLNEAKYQIKFSVEFDRIEQRFKFTVSLIKVEGLSEVITMEYFFADEEEMLLYSQLVFFMLMANLPEDEIPVPEDNTWQNKWLYINASFDYSLMLLALKSDGLHGGLGVYNDFFNPIRSAPIDNKIVPMVGAGLGVEVQFLDFMSIEPHAQISLENAVIDHLMYSLLFSVQLKFPLKFFSSFVIEPYGIAAYPMRFPEENEIFFTYPDYIFGGGIQVAVKAGKIGALFFDVSYLYLGDTEMNNYYGELYPKPETIHYDHSVLKFSIGYKFGFINRKTKE